MRSRCSLIVMMVATLVMGTLAYGQSTTVITYPPGQYVVSFPVSSPVVGPFVVTQTATSITVSWGPGPVPPVPVPPVPSPQTGDLFVLALFDKTAPLTPAQQAVQHSTTLATSLAGLSATAKTTWAVGDVSSQALSTWVPDARTAGLPAIVILAVDAANKGAKVEAIPLPSDEASIVAEIKKIRGIP
jgi:hypothetical protein